MIIKFTLNGAVQEVEVEAEMRLVDVLRKNFGLTGVKEACGEGECGACSILVDGKLELACLIPIIRAEGKKIVTIEGLGKNGVPSYVQQAFIDAGAIQCGFCTPGLVMAVGDYVDRGGRNQREAIKKALSGNICRCTGYVKVIEAVELAFNYRGKDANS